ncbi:MAG: hypothetical protein B0D92_03175 [Spirochaeta sp. LUC14_002_19_P3]|nr:MAG: hypothetical protein B0D92_03175 [Spirochaeta sp. LUC14_002_19_P3]
MYNVMFICTGNICRSPLAHAVMEQLVKEQGLEKSVSVDSSGTDAWHSGEMTDSRMRTTAARHGVKVHHRAQRLSAADFAKFNLLLVMDSQNYRNAVSLAKTPQERDKVKMFREFDPQGTGDVPDPWYGDMTDFETVWTMVDRTCRALLDEIKTRI